MLPEWILLLGFVVITNFFWWLLSSLIFFVWVASLLAKTVNSNLHNRWKKNVKKSPGSLVWVFGFRVEGANILFKEPTVIWEMLLLCELLLVVGFVAMNNFFFKKCSLHWFFLIEWLSSEPILSTLVYITEQNFFEKSSTKFKLESFDSASMSLTIIP